MTTTYATDAQIQLRSSFGSDALAAINAARARRSESATTLDAYRVEAQRQILVALRSRDPSILPEDITRPDDLIESEVCLSLALLCEAATQKGASRDQTTVDLFGQEAARWRERYDLAIAQASPVDGIRGVGRSFAWSRA